MSAIYGIKFWGPRRKDIWWWEDGPYGRQKLTFKDLNEACRWSDVKTQMYPHCTYLVMEIPHEEAQEKSAS